MKRLISMMVIGIVMLAAVGKASALGVSVGAAAWYADWQIREEGGSWETMDRTVLYGPVLALRFSQNLSLSSAFLYGRFSHTDGGGNPEVIARMDSDTTLIYGLGQYFKLFAGVKYMGYKVSVNDSSHASLGPGAGFGIVLPLAGNFYFTGNFSGMYLWGEDKNDNPGNNDFIEYGFNANAALTYVFTSAPVGISLGGRYQYIESEYEETSDRNMNQRIFGVTVSAIYSFEI
jgi:hypothetical protein